MRLLPVDVHVCLRVHVFVREIATVVGEAARILWGGVLSVFCGHEEMLAIGFGVHGILILTSCVRQLQFRFKMLLLFLDSLLFFFFSLPG